MKDACFGISNSRIETRTWSGSESSPHCARKLDRCMGYAKPEALEAGCSSWKSTFDRRYSILIKGVERLLPVSLSSDTLARHAVVDARRNQGAPGDEQAERSRDAPVSSSRGTLR